MKALVDGVVRDVVVLTESGGMVFIGYYDDENNYRTIWLDKSLLVTS